MPERIIELRDKWTLGDRVGGGSFGRVFRASSGRHPDAVLKLVPRGPGADRELLFEDLGSARNVVPVLDSGEADADHLALVMPRADQSLRDRLADRTKLSETDAIAVLLDIARALEDLDGRVVHRDLKPENVLFLRGHWSLADFGISRYAEASTAIDTRKGFLTGEYAAPEQWLYERATAKTDIYAVGIMAYEMLMGSRPFVGGELREQHLHAEVPPMAGVSVGLSTLVAECLLKAPGSRPPGAELVRRLEVASVAPQRKGLRRLQEANQHIVSELASAQAHRRREETGADRRRRLFDDGRRSFQDIAGEVRTTLMTEAPSISSSLGGRDAWTLRLGHGALTLSELVRTDREANRPFEVVAHSEIAVRGSQNPYGYVGRSHSLWYCDAITDGHFGWFELAFMESPLMRGGRNVTPFALAPTEGIATLEPVIGTKQLAWSPRRLTAGALDDFIEQWANRFADASAGKLSLDPPFCRGGWRG